MKTREKLKKIYTLEDSDEEEEIVISDSDDDFKPTTPKIPKKRKLKSEFEEKPVKKRKYNKKVKAEKKTEEIVVPHDDHSTSNNTNIENRIKKEENEEKDDIKPIRSYHEELSTSNTNIVNFHEPISENVTKRTIKNEYEEKDDIKPLRSYHDEPSTSNNTKIKRGIKNGEDVENDDVKPIWNDHELLAQQKDLTPTVAKNIVKLFEAGNTIPFIARYRRDATGNMSPEILRDVKDVYDDICHLKQKIQTVVKTVSKSGNLNSKLDKTIKSVRSIEELEIIYAPFKPGGKRSLAERGKELGLEEPALNLLYNTKKVDMYHYISVDKKELAKVEDVEKGIIHIIAYVIATDSEMLSYLRELRHQVNFTIESKKSTSKTKSTNKVKASNTSKTKQVDESKFENYFDFKGTVKFVKPHQILAINRGEHHKILTVKIVVPEFIFHRFSQFSYSKWVKQGGFDSNRKRILDEAIKDSYNRLVQPLIIREIRTELKTTAEKASYEVFSTNLKHLLLMAPVKGQPILAIDPGYTAGCKVAVVSGTGSVLSYNVIYPHKSPYMRDTGKEVLKSMLTEHKCSLIALGNGTACRETEEWLTELIRYKHFYPIDVKYTIVNEDGASIYSCSPEAKKEFPTLDTNIISAVSLARRIQDPLAELVKVEPQHLGVGMYQHDLKKKTLEEALNEVVSECVSFVGVDLNTASQCLLRRIAGLSDKRATQIIEHRERNGPFLFRKQLTEVFGIGARIFEQCAGFLRVGPADSKEAKEFYKKSKTTKLDCTYIHPESYGVTNKLIKKLNLKTEDIGEPGFINAIKSANLNISDLSKELGSTEKTLELILEALSKPLNYDLRTEVSQEALFRKGLTSLQDLKAGMVLTGRIKNVTHFGCFIDIGVGVDGLIHSSKLNGFDLQIGDRTEVSVINLDIIKRRIGLEAMKKL